MSRPLLRGPAVLLAALAAACAGHAPAGDEPEPPLTQRRAWILPADWQTRSPFSFEELCLRELPEGTVTPFGPETRETLRLALERMDPVSVRAAVLLGRSRHGPSAGILVRRLEQRVEGPDRASDAGDVVAAAALARFPDPERHGQRLVALAVGPTPHPDLEVRVECAATALYAGFAEVVPFLLQVLRIDTPAGASDARDFAVDATTAWARGRAAEALSLFAGVPVTYQPDGPIAAREEEARRLERLLEPALRPPPAPEDGAPQGSTR